MTRLFRIVRAIRRDRRGSVLMIFGFAVIPLVFAVGMGIDYARAMKAQTKLNAVADAAALVAVSKTVMSVDDTSAASFATQMFLVQAQSVLANAQVTLTGLTTAAPTDKNGRRTATVTYTGQSTNAFARILGLSSLTIRGTSVTTNATAPDIDFYMLLDVSSSMALPTTSAGLTKVGQSNSSGCQFACHSTKDLQGTDANGKLTDLYGVAKSYGLTLRIDDEGTAVSKLASNATNTSSRNGADYRMAISTFRGAGGFTTIQPLTSNLSAAATTTKNLQPSLFYSNGCPTQACKNTEVGFNDLDTGTSDAFTRVNTQMPTPGTGMNGKTPQAIMFIITDGMRDESRPGGRPEIAIDTAKCDAIKNRGIRIAVLYTEYLPQSLERDAWSQQNVAPYLYQVEPALQACASNGLYTKVSTDQDIYTALDALFQNAVATARISG